MDDLPINMDLENDRRQETRRGQENEQTQSYNHLSFFLSALFFLGQYISAVFVWWIDLLNLMYRTSFASDHETADVTKEFVADTNETVSIEMDGQQDAGTDFVREPHFSTNISDISQHASLSNPTGLTENLKCLTQATDDVTDQRHAIDLHSQLTVEDATAYFDRGRPTFTCQQQENGLETFQRDNNTDEQVIDTKGNSKILDLYEQPRQPTELQKKAHLLHLKKEKDIDHTRLQKEEKSIKVEEWRRVVLTMVKAFLCTPENFVSSKYGKLKDEAWDKIDWPSDFKSLRRINNGGEGLRARMEDLIKMYRYLYKIKNKQGKVHGIKRHPSYSDCGPESKRLCIGNHDRSIVIPTENKPLSSSSSRVSKKDFHGNEDTEVTGIIVQASREAQENVNTSDMLPIPIKRGVRLNSDHFMTGIVDETQKSSHGFDGGGIPNQDGFINGIIDDTVMSDPNFFLDNVPNTIKLADVTEMETRDESSRNQIIVNQLKESLNVDYRSNDERPSRESEANTWNVIYHDFNNKPVGELPAQLFEEDTNF